MEPGLGLLLGTAPAPNGAPPPPATLPPRLAHPRHATTLLFYDDTKICYTAVRYSLSITERKRLLFLTRKSSIVIAILQMIFAQIIVARILGFFETRGFSRSAL